MKEAAALAVNNAEKNVLFTIGHSNHPIDNFISLLKRHGITALADVRSAPYSRYHPQFCKAELDGALRENGIAYIFLGEELGARPDDPQCYDNGNANFAKISKSFRFQQGIERLIKEMEKRRIALMCAERDPLDCHRNILICRNLRDAGIDLKHILHDGKVEDNADTEQRLIRLLKMEPNLFDQEVSDSERLNNAYNRRSTEIAFKKEGIEDNE